MTWVDSAVPVGDELFLYYAGYRWGHKHRPRNERQLGLVKIKRERYVARVAGSEGGTIATPVVTLDGDVMTLNVTDGTVVNGKTGLADLDAVIRGGPGNNTIHHTPNVVVKNT